MDKLPEVKKTADELRQEDARIIERMEAISKVAEDDGDRELNEAEQTEWNNLDELHRSYPAQIAKADRKEAVEIARAELNVPQQRKCFAEPINHGEIARWQGEACLHWLQCQETGNNPTYEQIKRAKHAGFDIGGRTLVIPFQRDFQIAAAGQYTVPTTVTSELVKKLTYGNPLRGLCRNMPTSNDGTVTLHLNDDTGNSAQKKTESQNVDLANATPSKKTLYAVEYSTGAKASYRWMRSTVLDAVSFITEDLAIRVAKVEAEDFLTGAGDADESEGILTTAIAAVSVTAGTITFGNINTCFYAVPERSESVWMMNSQTLGYLEENLVDANDNLIFATSARDGAPSQLKGRPIVINEYMPSYDDEGVMPIVLFNPRKYLIRDVGAGLEIEQERSAVARTNTFVATLTSYGLGHWYPADSCKGIATNT